MRGLDPAVAAKLTKVCGLLASDLDGERSAAAWQATKILRSHGLTWADVLQPALPAPSPVVRVRQPPHSAAVQFALQHAARLSAWERQFLQDIARRWQLSPKQADILNRIVFQLRQDDAA